MLRAEQLATPASRSQAVAATTLTTFTKPTSGIFTGGAGNLIVTLENDTTARTFVVTASQYLPIAVRQIEATNAVALVALFNSLP